MRQVACNPLNQHSFRDFHTVGRSRFHTKDPENVHRACCEAEASIVPCVIVS